MSSLRLRVNCRISILTLITSKIAGHVIKQAFTVIVTIMGNLQSSINITWKFFECGEWPVYTEKKSQHCKNISKMTWCVISVFLYFLCQKGDKEAAKETICSKTDNHWPRRLFNKPWRKADAWCHCLQTSVSTLSHVIYVHRVGKSLFGVGGKKQPKKKTEHQAAS